MSECNVSSDSIKTNFNPLLHPYMSIPVSKKVEFRDKVDVALIDDNSHHPIINDTPITIDDTKNTAGKVGSIPFWKLITKSFLSPASPIASLTVATTNTFDALENNNTYNPVQYKSKWMLDSSASRVYGDMNTIVCKGQKIKCSSGIKV